MGSSICIWQAVTLSCILGWVVVSSLLDLTRQVRSLIQPCVTRRVLAETPLILRLQKIQHGYLDNLFSLLSCMVSVPFYTGFLPLLIWSGHARLGRQITLLMTFCDYLGNSIKDLISAPRPSCPPVRRVTVTEDEKENAMEYGLPSSHALNTVCLTGYLLYYVLTSGFERDGVAISIGFTLFISLVALISIGRIYLGMHSFIDVVAGIGLGLAILAFWVSVEGYIDDFIIHGKNVTSFWAGLSFLLCFAYPTPEFPTPSFEYHVAFLGVSFGVVTGMQQTFAQFHYEGVPRILGPKMPVPIFVGRVLVGIPTILAVKFCSKALSKWLLPVVCNTLGIPIRSTCYIPALKGSDSSSKNKSDNGKQHVSFFPHQTYDVDTGIRFLQYAGLAWSSVDLVPSIFSHLKL